MEEKIDPRLTHDGIDAAPLLCAALAGTAERFNRQMRPDSGLEGSAKSLRGMRPAR